MRGPTVSSGRMARVTASPSSDPSAAIRSGVWPNESSENSATLTPASGSFRSLHVGKPGVLRNIGRALEEQPVAVRIVNARYPHPVTDLGLGKLDRARQRGLVNLQSICADDVQRYALAHLARWRPRVFSLRAELLQHECGAAHHQPAPAHFAVGLPLLFD